MGERGAASRRSSCRQGGGHFLQVSSIGGISAFPGIGMYHASKWCLERISQALAQEVKGFGIDVTLIEPGGFSTDSGRSSAKHRAYDPYGEVHLASQRRREAGAGSAGDPSASADAAMRVVDAEEPPVGVFFGTAPRGIAERGYESRLAAWREWQPISEIAPGQK